MVPTLRATYAAAAAYAAAALPAQTFFSFVIGSLRMLLWSVVMVKGVFGWRMGVFGIVANVVAILGGVYPPVPALAFGILFLIAIRSPACG